MQKLMYMLMRLFYLQSNYFHEIIMKHISIMYELIYC